MNTFVTLALLLAVAGVTHAGGYGLGLGSPVILAPAAVSTQNMIKASPIPVIKTIVSPILVERVPIGLGYGLGGLGHGLGGLGHGLGGLSWGGHGVYGHGKAWL